MAPRSRRPDPVDLPPVHPDLHTAGRTVRSYVRRTGRMTRAQQRALQTLWDAHAFGFEHGAPGISAQFGRVAPLGLEIGSGNGEAIVAMATRHPENDYLAVEVHAPGLGRLLNRIADLALDNIRVAAADVMEVLAALPDAVLSEVYLYFPDPWPKKRHHKRRLFGAQLLDRLHEKLARHGRFYVATDCPLYARHVFDTLATRPGWVNLAGAGHGAPRPRQRPLTRFERRGLELGHTVVDFVLARA